MNYEEVRDFWETQKPCRNGKTVWNMIAIAIEKQIAKKPIDNCYCPVCGACIFGYSHKKYCDCGQKILLEE